MHHCYTTFMEPTGQIYSDLTGWFVALSSSGNKCILIIYNFDSNAILTEAFKTCHSESILEAYKHSCTWFCAVGLHPKLQCLDNEASRTLQEFMMAKTINVHLVPLHVHCCNTTEHAICTFKNHFIAGLCSTNAHFPIHLWNCLLPQAKLTLNLLCGSHINPSLSAWEQLHGTFDFNCTPIALPGIHVIIHKSQCNNAAEHHMASMGGTLDQH